MSEPVDLSRELQVAGKEPLRYLNRSLLDDENAREQAKARIRGLRDLATVNAWISVEKKIQRGPRTTVLEWLEDRRDDRLENGVYDFDDWLESTPKADPPEVPSVARYVRENDGEYVSTDGSDRGPHYRSDMGRERYLAKKRRAARFALAVVGLSDENISSDARREEPAPGTTPDVDTVGVEDQVALPDGGDDRDDQDDDLVPDVISDGGAAVQSCGSCGSETTDHQVLDMTRAWCPDCAEFVGDTR